MASGYLLLSCMAVLVMAMILIPPTSGGYGDCSRTLYKRISATQAITTQTVVSGSQSYRCGRLNWRRCHRTIYRTEVSTRYVARYQSASYVTQMCCTGFVGSPPNCAPVTCPRLSVPSSGRVHVSNTVYQSVATYSCSSQYRLVGQQIQTCLSNSRWSGSAPTCQRLRCPLLSNLPNGLVSFSNSAYVDGNATYTCSRGYELVGVSYRVCQHTETWSGSTPTCSRITCPIINDRSNDHMTVSVRSYYVDGITTYTCATGYQMIGSSRRNCLVSGQWNGVEPSCQRVTCPRLSSPSSGILHVGNREYQSVATYSCSSQYKLVGQQTQTCQSNRRWSRSAPTCQRLRCPLLSNLPNGLVSFSNSAYVDGNATYTCSRGYELVGVSYRVCQHTETWSGSTPTCSRITCPIINDRSNDHMTVSVRSYYVDGITTYTCATGYQMIGSSRRNCLVSGQWNGVEPSCQRVTCPRLSSPSSGILHVGNREYQSVATYSCSSQYKLVGQQTQTCQSNRRWSRSAPTCQRLRCPLLSNLPNGLVSFSNSAYVDGNATYTCSRGYELVGVSYRVCQHTETWSGSTPTCSRITCPTIDDLRNDHITVSVSSYYVDGIANYICASGFQVIGSSRRTCLASGQWNGMEPSCQRICVPTFGFAHPFLRITEGETVSVCIKNCSCTVEKNFIVELEATSPIEGEDVSNDLIMPVKVELGDHSMCFNVTAVDNELLEGYQSLSILLHKPPEEPYEICPHEDVIGVLIVDNDELIIGFENANISVYEAVSKGQLEACVVVFEPDSMVPIPDVVLELNTFNLSNAKPGNDYISIVNLPLPFSESRRKVCFNIAVLDDDVVENDESFSIVLERASSIQSRVPLIFKPEIMTVNILNDDGVSLGFERSVIKKEERDSDVNVEVCIVSRFFDTDAKNFSLTVQSSSLLATEGEDYKSIIDFSIGPFSCLSPKHCFDMFITGDQNVEPDESFVLTIHGEPSNMIVQPKVILVTILNDDEPPSCDNPPCSTNCTFTSEWSDWEKVANISVGVSHEICSSREMGVKLRQKNATTLNCEPKLEKKEYCT